MDKSKDEFKTMEEYEIKVLQQIHEKDTAQLVSSVFLNDEPLIRAYHKLIPNDIDNGPSFLDFWKLNSHIIISRGYSVGCFENKGGKLVGVSLVNTYCCQSKQIDQIFIQGDTFFKPVTELKQHLINSIEGINRQILDENKNVIQIQVVSIIPQYRGKGILKKMVHMNEQLAYEKGFRYGVCFASNIRTGVALGKEGYIKVAQADASNFELNGIKYFKNVEEETKYSTIWMKQFRHY